MIDMCEMTRFIDELPWPEGRKPAVKFASHPQEGYMVLLHEPISRGWADVARIVGPTPERCLRLALERWMFEKKLTDRPVFFAALKRLQN